MGKKDNILLELIELESWLPSKISNTNIYKIPDFYFEELPAQILLKIQAAEIPLSVPSNYFDTLSEQILQKIKHSTANISTDVNDEMQELSPALAALDKINPYQVPLGYFDNLAKDIIASAPKVIQAKVLIMRRMPAMVRYLVAAAFTGLVGFSLFSMFTNNKPNVNAQVMAEAKSIMANGTFDAELSTLTATDIENYLQEAGHDPDAAVAASAINDNNLPDEFDYLLNENTLNDYLKKTVAN